MAIWHIWWVAASEIFGWGRNLRILISPQTRNLRKSAASFETVVSLAIVFVWCRFFLKGGKWWKFPRSAVDRNLKAKEIFWPPTILSALRQRTPSDAI